MATPVPEALVTLVRAAVRMPVRAEQEEFRPTAARTGDPAAVKEGAGAPRLADDHYFAVNM